LGDTFVDTFAQTVYNDISQKLEIYKAALITSGFLETNSIGFRFEPMGGAISDYKGNDYKCSTFIIYRQDLHIC